MSIENVNDPNDNQIRETMMNLGAWLGRHQAFGMIANRCSAADAECLKAIRDGGEYKQLGLTWEQFCVKHAGVSRSYAEKQIHCLEEFGANYFRLSEVMPISPATYRLIAASVSEEGLESDGERIPLAREHREKLATAVNAARAQSRTDDDGDGDGIAPLRKRLEVLIGDAYGIARHSARRLELIEVLESGEESLRRLTEALRQKTLVLK